MKLMGEGGELEMPELTVGQLRKAAGTFKQRAAVGVDAITPRQMAWLSGELLQAVAVWLMAMEKAGVWHSYASTAIAHLIPKEAGGTSPHLGH